MTSVANMRQYEYPTTIAERSFSHLRLSRCHAYPPAACSAVLSRLLLVGRSCRRTNRCGLGALTLGLLHQLATFFVRLGFIHTFVSLSQPVGLAFDTSAAGVGAKGSDERDETKNETKLNENKQDKTRTRYTFIPTRESWREARVRLPLTFARPHHDTTAVAARWAS